MQVLVLLAENVVDVQLVWVGWAWGGVVGVGILAFHRAESEARGEEAAGDEDRVGMHCEMV